MPVFIALFKNLGINTIVLHDKDDISKSKHKYTNEAIINLKANNVFVFDECLEDYISYQGNKNDFMEFCVHTESLDKSKVFNLKL